MTDSTESSTPIILQDNQKEWLQQAEENFSKKNYSECLDCLNNFKSSMPKHWLAEQKQQKLLVESKVAGNFALCELALNSYKDQKRFRSDMQRIITEQESFNNQNTNDDKLTVNNTHLSAVYYNLAVLLYFDKEYGKALNILEGIYNSFNELNDDKLSRQISILFAELLIATSQPFEALTVLNTVEKELNKKKENNEITKLQQFVSIVSMFFKIVSLILDH